MTQQTIVAHFESRDRAEEAREALIEEGVSESAIRLYPEMAAEGYSRSTSSYDATRDEGGFWASLAHLFLPDNDRYAYAEGMSRGGATLSVTTDAAHSDQLSDILERNGAVDMDEQESKWRQEGWTGYAAGAGATAATGASMAGSTHSGQVGTSESLRADMATRGSSGSDLTTDPAMGSGAGMAAASMGATSTGSTTGSSMTGSSMTGGSMTGSSTAMRGASDEEVIPVVEEQLRVGKRETVGGRVRVRSYVVETPIEEQVSLRREHVEVERRPVDRAVTAGDAVFQERVIEAEEHEEEAVVSKEARIKEELVIRKDVETETQTIRDSVRRTEVEVEDGRTDIDRTTERTTGGISGTSSTDRR